LILRTASQFAISCRNRISATTWARLRSSFRIIPANKELDLAPVRLLRKIKTSTATRSPRTKTKQLHNCRGEMLEHLAFFSTLGLLGSTADITVRELIPPSTAALHHAIV